MPGDTRRIGHRCDVGEKEGRRGYAQRNGQPE